MIKRLLRTNLVKSASVYTLTKFVNSGIPFILLPILTRYLTEDEYGQLSMFNATVTFLVPFAGMSIGAGIQKKMIEKNEKESKEYIFNCMLILFVATSLVAVVMMVFSDQISKFTSIPKQLLPQVLITTTGICLINTTLCFYQIKEKPRAYALLQNLCTILNVALSILFVVGMKFKLRGRIYGISYSSLIFAIVSIVLLHRYIKDNDNKINKAHIKDEITNFALPLIPTEIKATVLTYMDRIFLTNMINVATTGVYALGNQFSLPLLFLEQAFNLAYVPWLYKNLKDNNIKQKQKIVKLTYSYFIVVPVIAVLWAIISKPIIDVISGKGYEGAHKYVIWLALGYAFSGMHMMVVNYLYYAKKLKVYAWVTVSVMVLNIFLNYTLISHFGPIGAAEATFICNVISFVFTWALTIRSYPMPWLFFLKRNKEKN